MTPRGKRNGKGDATRADTRSKSNYLRRRRVARPKDSERREVPNGPVPPSRRRV